MGLVQREGQTWLAGRANIRCLRGIREAQIELAQLTLLTGRNDSGKSSILEALALAFSAPDMVNALGDDVARLIIEGKLGGRPSRLINLVCSGEGEVRLEVDGRGAMGVRVAMLTDTTQLLCIALRSISLYLYSEVEEQGKAYTCMRRLMAHHARGAWDSEALATIILAVLYAAVKLAESSCSRATRLEDIVQQLMLPESIAESLRREADAVSSLAEGLKRQIDRALHRVTRDSLYVKAGSVAYLYTPRIPVGRHSLLPGEAREAIVSKTVALAGKILRSAGLGDLYTVYARLLLSRRLERAVDECIVAGLERALERLLASERIALGQTNAARASSWHVYTVFRRTLLREAPLVNDLRRVVDALHEHGLLEEYNKFTRRLGLRDVYRRNGELYFYSETLGESIAATLLGDGTLHLLTLLASLTLAQRQPGIVLLIEEPETGLHPGYMMFLADAIIKTIKENPQSMIVLSTHSEELIRFTARRAEKYDMLDRVAVALLSRGRVYSAFRGKEILEAEEIGVELRGL